MKSCLLAVLLFVVSSATSQTSDSTLIRKDSLSSKPDVEAQFPGGENVWNKYIQKNIEKMIDSLTEDKRSVGTAEVEFTVSVDGSISNVKINSLQGSVLADILYQSVKNGPKWVAATKNRQPVESIRKQKVTLRMPEEKEDRRRRSGIAN